MRRAFRPETETPLENKKLLTVGAVLIGAGICYGLFIAPFWTQRMPPGWTHQMKYVGVQTNAEPGASVIPGTDVLSEYTRTVRLISERGRPDSVAVEDRYVIREIANGRLQYDFVQHFQVDPRTGAHVDHPGEIFLFPRNVEKKTYRFRANYLNGIPLRFIGEEIIEGLRTYNFGYNGRGEYTQFHEGIIDGKRITIPRGIEVRCADDLFRFRVWVEPTTGSMVRIEESCLSGDYAYRIGSNQPLYAVDRFAAVTDGHDVEVLVDLARVTRLKLILLGDVPVYLLVGLGCVWILRGFRGWRRRAA